jgi:transcriptional regulator of aroF, aroG, tyrA and aromatic amino acid transport
MESHFSPIAIVEVDKQGYLLTANEVARELFTLPAQSQLVKFDYQHYFQIVEPLTSEKLKNHLLVISGQHHLLQTVIDQNKITFIIQPVSYLMTQLTADKPATIQSFDTFITKSQAMHKLVAQAKAFARQREPLLISGETGTGKDLLALACHQYSQRGEQVFLALNCAALPDEVVESELYGHASGAYPGIIEGKKGFFEQAHGGSVLLDGIDEMSPRMQTKLLRFINDGTFRRVGDDNQIKVDVRIICVTRRNLYSLVKQGLFREDLYYRLNVLALHIPPLRERHDDILLLAQFFITEFAHKQGIAPPKIAHNLASVLLNYLWPGNVRQLKNVLYSALAQVSNSTLTANDVCLPIDPNIMNNEYLALAKLENKSLEQMIKQFEHKILAQLYVDYPSSRKLSKRLGLSHTAVANKLREYGIGK